jgi:hypothetical protein
MVRFGKNVGARLINQATPTFEFLDEIVTELGGTKLSFYPLLQQVGVDIHAYGSGSDGPVLSPNATLAGTFDVVLHSGGVNSFYNDSSESTFTSCADNANHSFASAAFSVGAFIQMTEALGTARSIIAKWGNSNNREEYDFRLDSSGFPVLDLHDASESASEIATSDDAVTPFIWQSVVATYDGSEGTSANAGIALYIQGSAVSAITLTDSGTYSAMEDGAEGLCIGGRDSLGTVAQEFEGRIALPFVTGKQMTAANINRYHRIGQALLSIA